MMLQNIVIIDKLKSHLQQNIKIQRPRNERFVESNTYKFTAKTHVRGVQSYIG